MYVNDLHVINAHFQINAPYIIKAPLYIIKKIIRRPFLKHASRLANRRPLWELVQNTRNSQKGAKLFSSLCLLLDKEGFAYFNLFHLKFKVSRA